VVVDLGAGPCHLSAELRELGLHVISLDRSREMLMLAREQFPGPRVQADLRHLPLRPRSIAGVWASASLLHLEREALQPALDGIAGVLVPAGILYLSMKQGDGARWEASSYGEEAPRWFTYWSAQDIDHALDAAGFELLEAATDPGIRESWLVRIARLRGEAVHARSKDP
jgi:SAM-dependent methyltransferase